MENLFVIVNSDRSRFGAFVDRFCSGNPKVVNIDVDRLKTLLEVIESCSRIVDGPLVAKPSALCGSFPRLESTSVHPPKGDHPNKMAPPGGTRSIYPPMCPKWDEVTNPAKANKV